MPSIDDVYAGSSLKAADLESGDIEVKISKVEHKKFDDGDKLAVSFQGLDKVLICNKTNAKRISKLANTKDYSKWIGTTLQLTVESVEFRGDFVDAVRVKMHQPERPVRRMSENPADGLDDEVPF